MIRRVHPRGEVKRQQSRSRSESESEEGGQRRAERTRARVIGHAGGGAWDRVGGPQGQQGDGLRTTPPKPRAKALTGPEARPQEGPGPKAPRRSRGFRARARSGRGAAPPPAKPERERG